MALIQSIIAFLIFLLILGGLVVIHEVGHFVSARLVRVRVHEFGIGFPPRARVLRSEGDTLYTLNWLPIGGFVKLEGEDGESDDPRSFVRAPLPIRILILAAGAIMNLVLAFVIFAAVAWLPSTAIGLKFVVVQPDSPAAAAGLRTTDEIVSLDGRYYDAYDIGLRSKITEDLQAMAGQSVTIGVIRADGSLQELPVTLRSRSEIDSEHGALGIRTITVGVTPISFTRDPVSAIETGIGRTGDALRLILDGLGQVFDSIVTRPTEAPPASGPVGIAVQVGDVFWQAGPLATILLAGILSANLALVNILPFPPLDGGRILVLLVKAVAGQRVSLQAERLTYVVGFAFLFAFLVWITYFDIARIATGTQ